MSESPIEYALAATEAAPPEDGLRAVAKLRERLDGLEALHVEQAVRAGWSWRQIATVLGVTKQAVHKKHAKRVAVNLEARRESDGGDRRRLLVTGPARESVLYAREEAETLGAEAVRPEHLFVGLLRDDRGPVVQALATVGVSLAGAREEVARLHPRRRRSHAKRSAAREEPRRLPVSQEARDVMERSLREAVGRRDGHLGVEHLLLALLRDPDAVPVRVLRALGTTVDEVERALDQVLGRG